MRRSILKKMAIVLAGIVVMLFGRGCYLYSGLYSPLPGEAPAYEDIHVQPASAREFADDVAEREDTTVLIDLAHGNSFRTEELNVLMLRLISRGATIDFLDVEDDLLEELSGEARQVAAFVTVSPTEGFSRDEKEAIHDFLDKGGRLLLIADPTRPDNMNSLSLEFGLIFEPGYLYNTTEYETNYRNIFVSEFEKNEITEGLETVVFYTAGSISSDDGGIAFVDSNTFSSRIASRTRLSPLAMAAESGVLAVYDLGFMTEPYSGTLDNNRLVANIADWLMAGVIETVETEEPVEEDEAVVEDEEEEVVDEADGEEAGTAAR